MCARKKKRKPWTVQEVRTLEQHAHEGIGNLKKLLPVEASMPSSTRHRATEYRSFAGGTAPCATRKR